MSIRKSRVGYRAELNLTSTSTLHHLITVGIICSVFWIAIAATLST